MASSNASPGLSSLLSAARSGRLNRRTFMQRVLALGVTLPTAASLWSKAGRSAPVKGGQFRAGLDDGNTTDSMDPATYSSRFMITMAHTHRNFLTEISKGTEGMN